MTIQDENLLAEFLAESREHLGSIEPDLLAMEKETQNVDKETINRIFRAIHSIKGSAGFFGFETLKRLSHVMEGLLMQMRDGKLSPTSDIVDHLLAGVDKLNLLLDDIHNSEQVDCEEEISALEGVLHTPSASPNKTSEASLNRVSSTSEEPVEVPSFLVDFAVEPALVKKWLDQGKMLFNLTIELPVDAKKRQELTDLLNSMGHFACAGDLAINNLTEAKPGPCSLLYASVLDPSLLAPALGLQESEIQPLDSNSMSSKTELEPVKEVISQPQEEPSQIQKESMNGSLSNKSTEEILSPVKSEKGGTEVIETIRVRVDLLNKLMNLAGEMVLIRNQLSRALQDDIARVEGLSPIMQTLDLATSDLQEHIMQTRMQPIGNIFSKFPRLVRDLAKKLDKEIDLEMFGEDVELDKSLLEVLSDPLTHLIRNCCDHGLEPSEERLKKSKPKQGTITLRAYHEGGQIHLSIMDDGRGINAEKVVAKALKAGLITQTEVDSMGLRELNNLIFLPGLSTAERISDVSGRGVGMDVVKTNIERLGGHITLDSEPGMGTSILLRLPLTLAIIPSLIVSVQNYRFAISQVNLVELICIKASEISQRIERVGLASVLRLRGKLLPLVRLADILNIEREYADNDHSKLLPDRRKTIEDSRQIETDAIEPAAEEPENDGSMLEERRHHPASDYFVIVLRSGNHQYGLIVDNVLDLEQIVVKPLSGYFKACQCFNGATIMGDGKVALILDASGILSAAKMSFAELNSDEQRHTLQKTQQENVTRESVLLFNNAPNETLAIPLSSVMRLEKFKLSDIETVGRKEFITYRGHGLPLIRLEEYLPIKSSEKTAEEAFLIIPKYGNQEQAVAGIVASHIIDAIETELVLDNVGKQAGSSGTAIIQNRMTLLIDAAALLEKAGFSVAREVLHV